jgi:hypothetical protein
VEREQTRATMLPEPTISLNLLWELRARVLKAARMQDFGRASVCCGARPPDTRPPPPNDWMGWSGVRWARVWWKEGKEE